MPGLIPTFTLDQWSALSHKDVIGNGAVQHNTSLLVPSWVGDHRRRLNAYMLLQSYIDNVSRHFLPVNVPTADRDEHREYGDAQLLVGQILAALLGDDQEIVVDDARSFDPDMESGTVDMPEPDPADPNPPMPMMDGPMPDEMAANMAAGRSADREEWLRKWAKAERLGLKIIETERNAVGLGDGVYVLGWSASKNRPRLRIFDPGFYFPVIEGDDDEFPRRVHIAWEIVEDNVTVGQITLDPGQLPPQHAGPKKVRRITWELVPLTDERVKPEGVTYGTDDRGRATATRRYPWQDEDEDDATTTCLMSDGVWELAGAASPDDFTASTVTWQTNEDGDEIHNLDLGIDFLPVVHLPNTVSVSHHYGRSSLASVLQILDDIQAADTDLSNASALTGHPPIGISGSAIPADPNDPSGRTRELTTYGPGTVLNLGMEGKLSTLDTSAALGALIAYTELLLQRMATNARVPEAVLGRIRGTLPSGVALALSFGPLQSMVDEMRLVRDEKYPLLFRFAQRMAMAGGALPEGKVEDARLAFGSYLPVDKAAAVDQATRLLQSHAISRQTAVALLVEAGFEVDDAVEEVERIQHEDFVGAVQLLDATGDEPAVRDYLGLVGPPPKKAADPTTIMPVSTRFPPEPAPGPQPPAPPQPPQPPPTGR